MYLDVYHISFNSVCVCVCVITGFSVPLLSLNIPRAATLIPALPFLMSLRQKGRTMSCL